MYKGKTLQAGGVASVNVTAAGVHTFDITMREDGFVCDKIVLTTDAAYTPTGTGPAKSVVSGANVTTTLNGTASDADGNALATTWALVSGPAAVTVASQSALSTTATFTVAGAYTFRLTASDGIVQATDDVVVTVSP